MPTYEYACRACQSRIDIWFSSFAAAATEIPTCTVCGSKKLKRLISSSVAFNAGSQSTQPASTSAGERAQESPQMLARAMKKAGAGRNMGQEFNEVATRLEKGESPQVIEKSLRKRRGQKMGPH